MKKIISTVLVLAMVLTMALSVSADAKFDKLNGTYNVNFIMDGIYVLVFEPSSLAGGLLNITDNNNGTYTGSYEWEYDPTTSAVTVYDGNGEPTSDIIISWDMAGEPTFQCPGLRQPVTLAPANPSGGGSTGSTSTELVLGENSIAVEAYGATVCTFTATVADTYTVTAADGETNGDLMAPVTGFFQNDPTMPEGSWVGFPFTVTLAAGETVTVAVSSLNWQADTIDFTVSGSSGSANTGDSTAVYVAVGAVVIASILGCAIVSKKRVTE